MRVKMLLSFYINIKAELFTLLNFALLNDLISLDQIFFQPITLLHRFPKENNLKFPFVVRGGLRYIEKYVPYYSCYND